MNVFITIDTEVWPTHSGGWPSIPLSPHNFCQPEFSAYVFGDTKEGRFGLPFQLATLRRYGLRATYFVDPLFSFALGLTPLRQVVTLIEAEQQKIALHLHPEWLTDLRCRGLPRFRGPHLSSYPIEDQRALIRAGIDRLTEAGARPLPAFRAGSWAADVDTLTALRTEGVHVDSTMNARYPHSMPSFPSRMFLQDPTDLEGVAEYPVTRFCDRITRGGRPLTVTGTSWSEMRLVLESCSARGRQIVLLVMHSNEFVHTEALWTGRRVTPRRIPMIRFERLCAYLAKHTASLRTAFLGEADVTPSSPSSSCPLPRSPLWNTAGRAVAQIASRWF